ncbi:hypothetical protein Ddye_008475 [Dipteronia dyeriana]|uniref:CCHC-type domain-containing protein n=1 Tax=Dipteronia dyeriana TaxID=168575 RepID=A0AAE0CLY0_9ROSI|nr:hypothetical protein Ddye_008475 [Dipteronia dyeriana]
MTTSTAECIKSCLKFARQLPMLTMEEFIRNMLQCWFHDRHRAAQSVSHQLTNAAHLVILKSVDKYNFMTINPVDWNIFSVKRSEKKWTIDLARKTYTCNKFQMDHLPCSHALFSARDRNMDFTSLCVDYYMRQTLIEAYSVPIIPVGHPSTRIVPFDIVEMVVLNPISRRQAGRPRAGRHISSLERITTHNCRRCGQPGHNFRRCSNPALINKGPSRVIPEEYSWLRSMKPGLMQHRGQKPTQGGYLLLPNIHYDILSLGVDYKHLPGGNTYHVNLVPRKASNRGTTTNRCKVLIGPLGPQHIPLHHSDLPASITRWGIGNGEWGMGNGEGEVDARSKQKGDGEVAARSEGVAVARPMGEVEGTAAARSMGEMKGVAAARSMGEVEGAAVFRSIWEVEVEMEGGYCSINGGGYCWINGGGGGDGCCSIDGGDGGDGSCMIDWRSNKTVVRVTGSVSPVRW